MMKNLPASPVIHATFQSHVVIANKYCMRKHAKLLYTVPALMLIIIIMIYWSGKCLICRTGSDTHDHYSLRCCSILDRRIELLCVVKYVFLSDLFMTSLNIIE